MNSGIYSITNKVNGKRYVGSSVDLKRRDYRHFINLKNNKHANSYLQNTYNKYGKGNFTFKIIVFCSEEDLLFYEQRAMDIYNSSNSEYGYNLSPTAGNNLGMKMSEEAKRKISESRKGKNHTEETKKKMREAQKGKKHTEEAKRKISNESKGRKHTEETKKKMSEAKSGVNHPNWGKKFTEEHKKKLSEAHKEPIIVYKNEKYIKEFNSIKECAEQLNLDMGNISKVLTKKRKTCGGYTFEYKDK